MSATPGFSSDDDEDRKLGADDEFDDMSPLEADLPDRDEFAEDEFDDFDDEFDDDFEEQLEDEYGFSTDEDLAEEVLAEEEITNIEFSADFDDPDEDAEDEIVPFVADPEACEDGKAKGMAEVTEDEDEDEDFEDED